MVSGPDGEMSPVLDPQSYDAIQRYINVDGWGRGSVEELRGAYEVVSAPFLLDQVLTRLVGYGWLSQRIYLDSHNHSADLHEIAVERGTGSAGTARFLFSGKNLVEIDISWKRDPIKDMVGYGSLEDELRQAHAEIAASRWLFERDLLPAKCSLNIRPGDWNVEVKSNWTVNVGSAPFDPHYPWAVLAITDSGEVLAAATSQSPF